MASRRVFTTIPGRFAFAALILLLQFAVMLYAGHARLGRPFDLAPGMGPSFVTPSQPLVSRVIPAHWDRLLSSRWDSQHYLGILLRGYSQCPPEDLRGARLVPKLTSCGFNFYPGYPALGWAVQELTGLSADYSLLALSTVASFAFLFLFTSPTLVAALGVRRTYLALLFFSTFVSAFALVTNQTEPCVLLTIVGAFVAFQRGHYVAGAIIAGLAGSLRVTGCAVGGAYLFALAVRAWLDGGPVAKRALRVLLLAPLTQWGQLAIMAYFYARYRDPLLYVHAHAQSYAHGVSLFDTIFPAPAVVMRALTTGHHEGIFIAVSLLWLALGLRRALSGFSAPARAYWLALTVLSVGISLLGSAGLAFAGMNRYWLVVIPLFFAMAAAMEQRPVAAVLWIAFTTWHYWNVDLCVYLAQWDAASVCPIGYVP